MNGLTHIVASFWLIALAAFLLGLLAGTALSGKKSRESDDLTVEKIDALEAELKHARKMLETKSEEGAAALETLNTLDKALKRANGRLKLVLKSIKRAKGGK